MCTAKQDTINTMQMLFTAKNNNNATAFVSNARVKPTML